MTGEAFEAEYATRSGVTVEWLHKQGLKAVPCDCDSPECQGWKMMGFLQRTLLERDQLRTEIKRLKETIQQFIDEIDAILAETGGS